MSFNGSYYLWESISSYVASYIYIYDQNMKNDYRVYMNSFMIITITLGYLIGTYLFNTMKLSLKFILSLGSIISLTGFFVVSYCEKWISFSIFYAGFIGIGCGIVYFPPL